MLSIHCLVQPFQDKKHNYIETLSLLNLNAVCAFVQVTDVVGQFLKNTSPSDRDLFTIFQGLAIAFILFPLVAVVGYFGYLGVLWCRAKQHKKAKKITTSPTVFYSLTVADDVSVSVVDVNAQPKDFSLLRSQDLCVSRVEDFGKGSLSKRI